MVFEKLRSRTKREPDEDYLVGLDIGTEFVKALIARVNGETLEIVGVGRARQEVSDMHSGAIADIAGVVRNCEEALAQAEDQAGLQAKKAVIGIAGELVKGVTNTIKYRRPQPDRRRRPRRPGKSEREAGADGQRDQGAQPGHPPRRISFGALCHPPRPG